MVNIIHRSSVISLAMGTTAFTYFHDIHNSKTGSIWMCTSKVLMNFSKKRMTLVWITLSTMMDQSTVFICCCYLANGKYGLLDKYQLLALCLFQCLSVINTTSRRWSLDVYKRHGYTLSLFWMISYTNKQHKTSIMSLHLPIPIYSFFSALFSSQ